MKPAWVNYLLALARGVATKSKDTTKKEKTSERA